MQTESNIVYFYKFPERKLDIRRPKERKRTEACISGYLPQEELEFPIFGTVCVLQLIFRKLGRSVVKQMRAFIQNKNYRTFEKFTHTLLRNCVSKITRSLY
jgi:hypothetical protein